MQNKTTLYSGFRSNMYSHRRYRDASVADKSGNRIKNKSLSKQLIRSNSAESTKVTRGGGDK